MAAARAARGHSSPELFLWIWVLFVCVFFSLSDSKLIPYILPAMPALALLIAASPTQVLQRDVLLHGVLDRGCAIALALLCLFAPESSRRPIAAPISSRSRSRSPRLRRCSPHRACTCCRSGAAT